MKKLSEMILKMIFQTQEADNWGSGRQRWRQTRWSMSRIVSRDSILMWRLTHGLFVKYSSTYITWQNLLTCETLLMWRLIHPAVDYIICPMTSVCNHVILKLRTRLHPGLWINLFSLAFWKFHANIRLLSKWTQLSKIDFHWKCIHGEEVTFFVHFVNLKSQFVFMMRSILLDRLNLMCQTVWSQTIWTTCMASSDRNIFFWLCLRLQLVHSCYYALQPPPCGC